MLAITRHTAQELSGKYPNEATVWNSTCHQDFSKTYRTFIWKSLHSTHKIGAYWMQIPNFEQREKCPKCNVTEDMEHILLHCDILGQKIVWRAAKQLWRKKHGVGPASKT